MANQQKKISFGFSKLQKKNIFSKPAEPKKKVELIECVEAQSIKLKNPVKQEKKGPLVIPLRISENIFTKRGVKNETPRKAEENGDERPDSELTIDELAARELLREAQNKTLPSSHSIKAIEINKEEHVEGVIEPTLDDYDSVPINQFGMAMLRGMGWSEGMGIGKNNKSVIQVNEPELRPKGMGLGVNMNNSKKSNSDSTGESEEFILKKGGFAKVIEGNHKGTYCEVQGFDEEGGRIIVKTAINGVILNLSEFLVKPISKDEYKKYSKILNKDKYEEYKSSQDTSEKSRSKESHKSSSSNHKEHKRSSRDRESPYGRTSSKSHRDHNKSSHRDHSRSSHREHKSHHRRD